MTNVARRGGGGGGWITLIIAECAIICNFVEDSRPEALRSPIDLVLGR
jgi:hypothetical protein